MIPKVLCGMATVGTVGFSNLTLQHSSIGQNPHWDYLSQFDALYHLLEGFYQLSKLAIIPAVMLIETVYYGKTYSRKVETNDQKTEDAETFWLG